jgi:transketolase
MDINNLEQICTQTRRDIVRMIHEVQSGHPGGALSCTEYMVTLFNNIMNRADDFNMKGEGEDLFFLSNGHISALLYSVLARCGYFPLEELSTFRKLNSRLQGHPTNHSKLPGVRVASGSLGQGLSVAIGSALGKKTDKDPNLVYCLMGDGELQEGQVWEAAMYASANKIDNVIAAVDYNKQQIDGSTDEVLSLGDLRSKFESFGWQVVEVLKGNDIQSVIDGFNKAKDLTLNGSPVCMLLHTTMGHGVDFMMQGNAWHGKAPNDEQLVSALSQNEETLGDY